MHLAHGGVDVAVGQAGQTDVALRIVPAEVHEPVIVDSEHLAGGLVVPEPAGRAEDAEEDFGVDTVALHVGATAVGIGRPADALLAVLVEPGRRHDVDPIVLAGHVLLPGRPDAAD
jgi:hypothetical protein